MNERRRVISLLALFCLSGCATTPTPSGTKMVATDRVIAFQTAKVADAAKIVVTRDSGFIGSGCYQAFWINRVLAARFDAGETATFTVAPGEYVLRIGRDPKGNGLCITGQDVWTERETVLHANETKRFRLTTDSNGKMDVERGE